MEEWWVPKSNNWCSYKERREHRKTHREGPMKEGAEIGAVLPQAKECLGPPEPGRGKKGFFPRAFRGRLALSALRFWTSSLQNSDRIINFCFFQETQFVVFCYGSPRK